MIRPAGEIRVPVVRWFQEPEDQLATVGAMTVYVYTYRALWRWHFGATLSTRCLLSATPGTACDKERSHVSYFQ